MFRCSAPARRALFVSLGGLLVAASFAASAQVQRNFPATALRGSIAFGQPPEIALNGADTRLSPGARIRGADNMLQMSGALMGRKFSVNYTLDILGQVHEVWLLRPEEAAVRPWPRTTEELQTWSFDPTSQTWTKP